MTQSLLTLAEALTMVSSTFLNRFGRSLTIHEQRMALNIYLHEIEFAMTNSNTIVSAMNRGIYTHLARAVAISLQAEPTLLFARPVLLRIGTPTPTGELHIFPAAIYQRNVDEESGVTSLYTIGLQPKFIKRGIRHGRYVDNKVVSHGYQMEWTTVQNPNFAEFWPHGACWLSSIYPEGLFAKIDDPLKPTKEFGRTLIEDLGWKDTVHAS